MREFVDRLFVPAPVNPNYLVADDGTVFSKATGRFLSPCRLKRGGYLAVNLFSHNKGRTWPIHQLVALSFHGPRPHRHDAAHNDGNRLNNNAMNIRWATRQENERDKVLHGTSNRGDRNGMSRAKRMRRQLEGM